MDCRTDFPYSQIEFSLLNDWQHDFPLVPRPYAELAAALAASEHSVLATLRGLCERGAVSRVGAVLAPRRVGASTLAALAVPPARLDHVAALVNALPGINHNYQREHRYNLWFVLTAADQAALAATLDLIALRSACPLIRLPLAEQFHIDLGFDLRDGRRHAATGGGDPSFVPDDEDRRLIAQLQPGLALSPRPYARLGEASGLGEAGVLARLRRCLATGVIKRLGIVVRHHELGYRANAMVVFDLADDRVSAIGRRLAAEPGVTLCYRRNRDLPDWPYNLYCMVHGRCREEVLPVVDRLGELAGQRGLPLFSLRRYKQRGAHYFDAAPARQAVAA
jgi:DNA-binding Lrp family transcriptional regulator